MLNDEKDSEGICKDELLILGIDQGIASIGFSILKLYKSMPADPVVVEVGTFKTTNKKELSYRIKDIYEFFENIIKKYENLDFLTCEKLFYTGLRSSTIMDTNLVTGALYLLSANYNIKIKQNSPPSIKKEITGNGRATKEDIEQSIIRICEINGIIDLKRTEHANDAIAIAYTCGLQYYRLGPDEMFITESQKKKELKKLKKQKLKKTSKEQVAKKRNIKKV